MTHLEYCIPNDTNKLFTGEELTQDEVRARITTLTRELKKDDGAHKYTHMRLQRNVYKKLLK